METEVNVELRKKAIDAMLEGILAALYASKEGDDALSDCLKYAQAALASLENAGFKVEMDANRT